ncbi:Heparinase II/III-like protein [Opitutaceae bacterium TAV1]|nr:Heparinase II/III-like protein [Opitutaceae bacterium TAV1]
MQNLLRTPPARDALHALFRQSPPLSPLPPFGDPRWTTAFTAPAAGPALAAITRLATDPAERDAPLPELTDALYRDYAATGTRIRFEKPYFARRRRLARAAIALLASPDAARDPQSPLLRSFIDKLEDIFAEGSWALPAHVHDTPSGRDPLVIDLFAAETAHLMAELFSVFAAIIPPDQQAIIRKKLRRDIFENYLATDCWWMLATNNWNAVCHQGVLGAALTIEDDPDLLAALVEKAARHLPAFLDGFGDDGACSEGPAYWDYGFGWFALLNEQLETRTRGEWSLFACDEKIRRIAAYGPAMSLHGGHVVNFADCRPDCVLRPSTLQYLGATLDLPDCLRQAGENYTRLATPPVDCDFQRTDFLFWSRFFLRPPAGTNHSKPGTPNAKPGEDAAGVFLPSLGVRVIRGRDRHGNTWELAAKGGHNAEHHNHNDVGNFLLHINGIPFVAEIGMPEYNAAYFSEKRYSILAARTLGHSLPLINGCEQAAGAEFSATVRHADLPSGATFLPFEADLTRAWPAAANCKSFIRGLSLDPHAGVCLWTDTIHLNGPGTVESGFITGSEHVTIESPAVLVIREPGATLEFRIRTDAPDTTTPPCAWTRIETHPCSMPDGTSRSWRRAILAPSDTGNQAAGITGFSATVKITLRA